MKRIAAVAPLLVLLVSFAQPASAKTTPGTTDNTLWGTNTACAVISPSDVRCYPTEADMEAATTAAALGGAGTAPASTDSVTAYCGGRSDLWLYLYEDANYGGRVLKFRDANLWQNLSLWGFSNAMSSWRNDTFCTTWAADGDNGPGDWLTLSASSSSSYVGATWNDRVSSIYIVG